MKTKQMITKATRYTVLAILLIAIVAIVTVRLWPVDNSKKEEVERLRKYEAEVLDKDKRNNCQRR